MKLVPTLVIAGLVAGAGYVAYKKLPGLRTKVDSTVDAYGGWTEEARAKDPVGFLEHAEAKLNQDLQSFRTGLDTLGLTRTLTQDSIDDKQSLAQVGEEVLAQLKQAYQSAEADGSWPATAFGRAYTRDELIQQTSETRAEMETAAATVSGLEGALEELASLETDLRQRIRETEAALVQLQTQKQIVKVRQITAETDALMAQVAELMGQNQRTSGELTGPVRDLQSLLDAAPAPTPAASSKQATLDYLEN